MSAVEELVIANGRLSLQELCPADKPHVDHKMKITLKRVVVFIIVVVVVCVAYVLLSGHFKKQPASEELQPGHIWPPGLDAAAHVSPAPQNGPGPSAQSPRLLPPAVKEGGASWKHDKDYSVDDKDTNQQLAHHFGKQLQQQQQAKILQELSAKLQHKAQSDEKEKQQQQQQLQQQLRRQYHREIPLPMVHLGAEDSHQRAAFPAGKWAGDIENNDNEIHLGGFRRPNLNDADHVANKAQEGSAIGGVSDAAHRVGLRSNGFFRRNPAPPQKLIDAAAMFAQARQRARVLGGEQQNEETVLAEGVRGPPALNNMAKGAAKLFEEAGRRNQQKLNAVNGQWYGGNRQLARQREYFDKVGRWPRDVNSLNQTFMNDVQDPVAVSSDHFGQVTDAFNNVRAGDEADAEVFSNIKLDSTSHVHAAQLETVHDPSRPTDRTSDVQAAHVTVHDLSRPADGTFKCVPLKLWMFPRTLCVHSHSIDSSMSEQLAKRGTWEEDELAQFLHALDTNSALGALDLGAGLGVYSLAAATKFRQVLAVEPLYANYRLFHKTAQLNAITDRVTLVTNALGAKAGVGRLVYPHPTGNLGAAYVQPVNGTDTASGTANIVYIVSLDDLIPVMKFRTAVLKLDVQGDEHEVLKGAKRYVPFLRACVRVCVCVRVCARSGVPPVTVIQGLPSTFIH